MESKTILRSAFQLIAEGDDGDTLILLDVEGTILSWNEDAQALNGYTAHEIIGQHFNIFYLPKDRQHMPHRLLNDAKQKGRAVGAGQKIRRNGTIFWGSLELLAIHDDSGAVIGFAGRMTEILEDNDCWFFWFDSDGVLHVKAHYIANTPEKIAEFRRLLSDNIQSTGKICCIADLRDTTLSDEGIAFSKVGVTDVYKAIAYITNSLVDPITSKVISSLASSVPIAAFTNRPEAKAWIKQYS